MGSPIHYACCGKEMLGWICEKMATPKSTLGGGMFYAFGSTTVGNGVSACNNLCAPSEDYSTVAKNGSWDNTHTFNPFSKGKRLGGEPNTQV